MLRVKNLSSKYGGILALDQVSLEVSAGATVALIGSNGAGKSTLLNTLVGAQPDAGGEVVFMDRPLLGLECFRIARHGMLLVPEGRQILAPLSVRENLELGTQARGARKARYDLGDVFELFPRLKERQGQVAGSLSGGEQQMLAIGRALMGAPEILLLDEPSLGLSPVMVNLVFDTLRMLNRNGLTILIVEQNARRALQISNKAYVLERGRIVRQGDSEVLRNDPEIATHYLGEAA
ncbi:MULTISPECIES: ABC transporter ATP-binding protein [unclassified Variovorax]|uniref:ABC transporter ATP-binding protein n=1 Tax=unclassified Variovorax TaxID=663243 RepID=UPI001C472816|nr:MULTISPECIES: ABC transporter ATP-binding protein [unclassified Variovorax]